MIYLEHDKIFAAFRLPGTDKSCLILQNDKMLYDYDIQSFREKGFIVHPFSTLNNKSFFIKADEVYHDKEFVFIPEKINTTGTFSKKDYLKSAKIFLSAVKTDFEKLVLSRIKSIKAFPGNIYLLFQILCKKYPKAFVFIFNHPYSGTWIGASPEILISGRKKMLSTTALAGTQLILKNHEPKWNQKEINEQASVMTYIEEILDMKNLEFIKNGPFNKIAAEFESQNLVHLATEYLILNEADPYTLAMDLHPTPAVCGIPKQDASMFILEQEIHDRAYYSGFLGPVNYEENDELHLFVNLRSMEVFSNEFLLYIGGGMNDKSTVKKEWKETENKARTLETAIEEYFSKIKPPKNREA
ncbi:MAG: chorismate-binding protein [Deltaproteobacteria bacterium]